MSTNPSSGLRQKFSAAQHIHSAVAPNDAFVDACFAGDLESVNQAIASQTLTTEDFDEGLECATERAHPDVVLALFHAGATIKKQALEFLLGPEGEQSPLVIRHYLDHGMDPNTQISGGIPLLNVMTTLDCARELLSRGADPNIIGSTGCNALVAAIATVKSDILEYLELLIEYGAQLEPQLLFSAVAPRVPRGEVVTHFLLSRGMDPNTASAKWGTPLYHAVRTGNPGLVKALLDAGADPLARATGTMIGSETPLERARRIRSDEGRSRVIELLQAAAYAPGRPSLLSLETGENEG